jgi:hypothetical protein
MDATGNHFAADTSLPMAPDLQWARSYAFLTVVYVIFRG